MKEYIVKAETWEECVIVALKLLKDNGYNYQPWQMLKYNYIIKSNDVVANDNLSFLENTIPERFKDLQVISYQQWRFLKVK